MTDLAFGSFRLKRQERLFAGPDGPIELSARAFDLLVVLLNHPGEVVSKDALFVAVWPGVVVEENTLQVHISALRKALPPEMIATVHGRGYRYAGPVPEPVRTVASPVSGQPRATRGPVIVVLPFTNLGGNLTQQYFSDGITQDITDRLTRFRMLSVIGLDSSVFGQTTTPDVEAIRSSTNADFLVSGSIRRSKTRLRISVRLTYAASHASVWAEQYDRPIADLFDVQDEVADMVAATISRQLEIEISSRSMRQHPASLKIYDLTLRAVWHYFAFTRDSMKQAIVCCEQALAEDPDYREALVWLGNSKCARYEIDFDLGDLREGMDLVERVIKLDPTDSRPFVTYSLSACIIQGLDAARSLVDHALRLNPGDYYAHAQSALVSIYDGDHAQARGWLHSLNRLTPNPLPWVAQYEPLMALQEHRFRDAIPALLPCSELAWQMMYLIACYGHIGERHEAQAIVARFVAQGRVLDFHAAAAREPYVDRAARERLIEGIRLALG